jgi:Zn-dependent membrane protease YugP
METIADFFEIIFADTYYTIYFCLFVVMILTLIASHRVNSTFRRYSRRPSTMGYTAEMAVARVLEHGGAYGVKIRPIRGNLTDNFDPRTSTVSLSTSVYGSSSIAAIGVAAHEAGHAVQHSKEYLPVRIRTALVPIVNFASKLVFPLIIIGVIVDVLMLTSVGTLFVWLGIIAYAMSTLFMLVTLPVELNASRRALTALRETGVLTDSELPAARKVLRAAAWTYITSFAYSLLQLLRLIAIFGNRRR